MITVDLSTYHDRNPVSHKLRCSETEGIKLNRPDTGVINTYTNNVCTEILLSLTAYLQKRKIAKVHHRLIKI